MSVGPISGPVQRPSLDRDVDELLGRVEVLERVKPGGGLQFHEGTYGPENVGDWLFVNATSYNPGTGYGIEFDAAFGVLVQGDFGVLTGSTGLTVTTGGIDLNSDTAITLGLTGTNSPTGYAMNFAGHEFRLGTGDVFVLKNAAGAAIFRVDQTGAYHIKTGATWVADL